MALAGNVKFKSFMRLMAGLAVTLLAAFGRWTANRAGQAEEAAEKRALEEEREPHASEADTARIQEWRRRFRAWISEIDIRRLVFIDETGSTISMSRQYAWAPRGTRAEDAIPRNRGTVTTIIGALTVDGLTAVMTLEGGTTGDVFVTYVERVLLPQLLPGDIVVMNNLPAHKDSRVRPLIESVRAHLVYQPAYSPDMNPIELAWSKLKWWLRSTKARTHAALDAAIATAMEAVITADDAFAWFAHCGYQTVLP